LPEAFIFFYFATLKRRCRRLPFIAGVAKIPVISAAKRELGPETGARDPLPGPRSARVVAGRCPTYPSVGDLVGDAGQRAPDTRPATTSALRIRDLRCPAATRAAPYTLGRVVRSGDALVSRGARPAVSTTGYSRSPFVAATAEDAATAALAGRSEASTRYASSGPSHTSGSCACRTRQPLYARASRSEAMPHAVATRGRADAMSSRRI